MIYCLKHNAKYLISAIMLTIVLLVGIGGEAHASYKDGYLKNVSCVQPVGIGISVYPYYSGYQRIVNACGGNYSNLNSATFPQAGDLTGLYIGAGWHCYLRFYSHVTGAFYRGFWSGPTAHQGIDSLNRDLLTVDCRRL